MKMTRCIILLVTYLLFFSTYAQNVIFFEEQIAVGAYANTFGKNSSIVIADSTAKQGTRSLKVFLSKDFQYAGTYIALNKPIDLTARNKLYLTFWIKGDNGNERIEVQLKDTYKRNGDYDLAVSLPVYKYTTVTREWQQVIIPLTDFPEQGTNWDKPPHDHLPHMGKFEWDQVNTIVFSKTEEEDLTFYLDHVVITSDIIKDPVRLITPLTVSKEEVDFSKGQELLLTAGFNRPVNWTITINNGSKHIRKTFTGKSKEITQIWDGTADKGAFNEGMYNVKLSVSEDDNKSQIADLPLSETNVKISAGHSFNIKVNQVGYLPKGKKLAFLSNAEVPGNSIFHIKEETTGTSKYSGTIQEKIYDADSRDTVSKLDFTRFETPGRYYIEIKNVGRSYAFEIKENVYYDSYKKVARSFYYQRCGMDLESRYAGNWPHQACHLQDAFVYEGYNDTGIVGRKKIQSTGGWHDAGDYGKKIVPAAVALYFLMKAHEDFPNVVDTLHYNIPALYGSSLPDILNEVRFELEWILSCQREDGGVYALITSPNFFFGLPEFDKQDRYLCPVSTAATGDFAAIMAMASRIYRNYDSSFDNTCLKASERAWAFLQSHREIIPTGGYSDPSGINRTGTYGDKEDKDERFWAAAELFHATHKQEYNDYVKANYASFVPLILAPGWIYTQGFGAITYTLTEGGDMHVRNKLRKELIKGIDQRMTIMEQSGYSVCLKTGDYYYGSNYGHAAWTTMLLLGHKLTGREKYKEAALLQLNYIFGANALGLSFVSGTGIKCPQKFLQGVTKYDNQEEPLPGFLVGGPNKNLNDPVIKNHQAQNDLPPAKCYIDDYGSYSTNEIGILNSGPLVYVLSAFLK